MVCTYLLHLLGRMCYNLETYGLFTIFWCPQNTSTTSTQYCGIQLFLASASKLPYIYRTHKPLSYFTTKASSTIGQVTCLQCISTGCSPLWKGAYTHDSWLQFQTWQSSANLMMRSHNPYPQKSTCYWLFPPKWDLISHYFDDFCTHPVSAIQITQDPTTHPSPTATPTRGIGPRPLLFWTPLLFRAIWAPGIPLRSAYYSLDFYLY